MIYVYDVLLNFNDNLIEFYNWNTDDNIYYIKKIPLFKVSDSFVNDIIYNTIELDDLFISSIKNKCILYDNNSINACILSSDAFSIAVLINDNKIDKVSRMTLQEEDEVLNIISHLNTNIINYKKLNKIDRNINISTKDKNILDILKKEFNYLYNNNEIEKLNYYYFEYFNKVCNDKNITYKELIDSLIYINDKHKYLYKIIKLSYQNKD